MDIQTNLLQEAKEAFANVRGSTVVAMKKLWEVKESEAWKAVAENWSNYVQSELDISEGFASKLIKGYRVFVIESGIDEKYLEGVDSERLYLAAPLIAQGVNPIEALSRAKTLTRAELKQERQEAEPHAFELLETCKVCHASRANHS